MDYLVLHFRARGRDSRRALLVPEGATIAPGSLNGAHHLVGVNVALRNTAKDDVLPIEPLCDDGCDEELRTVAAAC